ncbi:hypothetical protein AKJ16_DCAP01902, partial [Drosera capensis]
IKEYNPKLGYQRLTPNQLSPFPLFSPFLDLLFHHIRPTPKPTQISLTSRRSAGSVADGPFTILCFKREWK